MVQMLLNVKLLKQVWISLEDSLTELLQWWYHTDPQAAMLNDTSAVGGFACASLSISFGLDKPSGNTHP